VLKQLQGAENSLRQHIAQAQKQLSDELQNTKKEADLALSQAMSKVEQPADEKWDTLRRRVSK
jgi:vacuolar-type H+-ATPase subunit H